ncbi:LysM domain-containing protein [Litoreibacter ponti]|uniref:LysM domain-containing protein n=1 Tax=Litoreibacter ponti TaxID=1510457 RepID=A0A2T6BLJ4_9RHOB|nr:LysM domain-containing protein [Litoreibacter ponti]PTX56953.1 LysM domain-containing protein [Litoreibacter ponti]
METYTVQPGDSLSAIAREAGVSLTDMLNANPGVTDPSRIRVGQELNMPDGSAEMPAADGGADDAYTEAACNCEGPVFLHFDGFTMRLYEVDPKLKPDLDAAAAGGYTSFLNWVNANKASADVPLRLSEDAMAGKINYNSRRHEHLSNFGPTPHGLWKLDFTHWRASDPDPNDGRVENNSRGKFTHHNQNLADRDRVAVNNWNVDMDFGSGGWAIAPLSLPTGIGGRSGFVFHEDANANGSAGCLIVGYRKILPFYDIIFPTVTMGFDTVYVLVENYDEGRQRPNWTRHGTSVDE